MSEVITLWMAKNKMDKVQVFFFLGLVFWTGDRGESTSQ